MMLNAEEQRIVDDIEQFGWHVTCVGPAIGSEDRKEWFGYTIGLAKTFGWPELICFHVDLTVIANLLNLAVEECRRRGVAPSAGLELTGVVEGAPARLAGTKPMADSYVKYARWFAEREGLPLSVLQLLWPDNTGHFPDDPGCDQDVRRWQTPMATE
jgi:hypothetical protein